MRLEQSKLHKVEEWQRRVMRLREYKDYSAQEEKFLKLSCEGLQGVCQYCGSAPSIQWHMLCTRVDSCAAEVKEALSFIFLRCSSYEFNMQQVFLGIQGFNF